MGRASLAKFPFSPSIYFLFPLTLSLSLAPLFEGWAPPPLKTTTLPLSESPLTKAKDLTEPQHMGIVLKVLLCAFHQLIRCSYCADDDWTASERSQNITSITSRVAAPARCALLLTHMCGVWMDGRRDRIRSKVRGQDGARAEGRVVSQPICSSSLIPKRKRRGREGRRRRRRESNTKPAILFLSSAATAFVAMTTQADDLIAVTFECCSLKEPVTQDRKHTDATQTGTGCLLRGEKTLLHRFWKFDIPQRAL